MEVKIFHLLLLLLDFFGSVINVGPADVTIEKIDKCANSDQYNHPMTIIMTKMNKTHAKYSGCIDLPGNLDISSALNLTVEKWENGKWKRENGIYNLDLCATFRSQIGNAWKAMSSAAGRKNDYCPVFKQKYCVEKLIMDTTGHFSNMAHGKFRCEFKLLSFGKPFMCIRAVINSSAAKSG